MRSSFSDFLRWGHLGVVHTGMTAEQVKSALGPAESEGGTSRKYNVPSILKYGDLEVILDRSHPQICTSLYIELPRDGTTPELPVGCRLPDWNLTSKLDQPAVVEYLQAIGVAFETSVVGSAETRIVIADSVVQIHFDETDHVWSVGVNSK